MESLNPPPPNAIIGDTDYYARGVFVDDNKFLKTSDFIRVLLDAVAKVEVRDDDGKSIFLDEAILQLRTLCRDADAKDRTVRFIGNGGSAALASHMAIDYTKNANIRATAFNDAPTLSCLGNDYGFEEIFSKQLEYYAQRGDVIIIISSSGASPNILKAAEEAFAEGLDLITFSGMSPENPLRRKGILRFWVPATDYGIIELSHLILLHSVVSITTP